MGHDISGYTTKDRDKEIAYLRRSAGNELAREIYKALKAEEYDCGCSGCGDSAFFSVDRLRTAAAFIADKEGLGPEMKFLADCIANADSKGVWIGFY